jgi:hypothetical protein
VDFKSAGAVRKGRETQIINFIAKFAAIGFAVASSAAGQDAGYEKRIWEIDGSHPIADVSIKGCRHGGRSSLVRKTLI